MGTFFSRFECKGKKFNVAPLQGLPRSSLLSQSFPLPSGMLLAKLEKRANRAFNNSKKLESDGQASPLTALTYQRELVEIQQRVQRLEKDLSLAKIQLAALMNIKPGEHFELAQPRRYSHSTQLKMSGEEMVFAALENRPEIRDIQYKLRINEKETKRALLELLPGVNLFAAANWDSDSYINNSSWVSWGAKATWNMMQVFKYPAQKRLIQAKDEVLDARALAVTMAIMTQVHVSRVRYGHSRKLYKTAARHLRVQEGIVKQIRASFAEGQASEQTLIREEMNTLVSRVSADVAYADLQNSYANIFASMGLDPYPGDLNANQSLAGLSAELKQLWIERGDKSAISRAMASAKAWRSANDPVHTGTVSKKKRKQRVSANTATKVKSNTDPFVAEASNVVELPVKTSALRPAVLAQPSEVRPKNWLEKLLANNDAAKNQLSREQFRNGQ